MVASHRACDADQVALGVGELADDEESRFAFRTEHAGSAELFGLLERGLYVVDTNVEERLRRKALAAADSTVEAGLGTGTVARSTAVDEAVVPGSDTDSETVSPTANCQPNNEP